MNQTNKVFYTLVAIFLSCSIEMAGQVQKVISGTVTELFGKTAEPLVGVNVNLVNNQNRSLGGGITNLNGQYNVKVPEGEKDLTIVYSYIGMKTKRIKYTGQTLLNVTLESESMAVDEVKGRLNSHFSLVYMPCFPIRFVNRNDKEINVFLFFSLLYKPNLGYYSLLDKHMM